MVRVQGVGPGRLDDQRPQGSLPHAPAPQIARKEPGVAVVEAVLATRDHAVLVRDDEAVVLLQNEVVDEVHTQNRAGTGGGATRSAAGEGPEPKLRAPPQSFPTP